MCTMLQRHLFQVHVYSVCGSMPLLCDTDIVGRLRFLHDRDDLLPELGELAPGLGSWVDSSAGFCCMASCNGHTTFETNC